MQKPVIVNSKTGKRIGTVTEKNVMVIQKNGKLKIRKDKVFASMPLDDFIKNCGE